MENSTKDPLKIKIELSCDAEIPLLALYPKDMKSGSQEIPALPCSAVLLTTAGTGEQPRCLRMRECVEKMWCM